MVLENRTFTIDGRGMWIPGRVIVIKNRSDCLVSFGDNGNMSFDDGIYIYPGKWVAFSPMAFTRHMRVRTMRKCKAIIECVYVSKE